MIRFNLIDSYGFLVLGLIMCFILRTKTDLTTAVFLKVS